MVQTVCIASSFYLSFLYKIEFFILPVCNIAISCIFAPRRYLKGSSVMDTKKEELIKAIKQAMQHKEEARKKTAEEWKREGIKGKVTLI